MSAFVVVVVDHPCIEAIRPSSCPNTDVVHLHSLYTVVVAHLRNFHGVAVVALSILHAVVASDSGQAVPDRQTAVVVAAAAVGVATYHLEVST